jgi:hypothetical protein
MPFISEAIQMGGSLEEDFSVGCDSIPSRQPRILLCPLLLVVRTPGGVGALRTMTSSSPVPFTTVTEENIHAKGFFDPQFEFV